MGMIYATSSGSFDNTEKFLKFLSSGDLYSSLPSYGMKGVDALSNATPRESGETAEAWDYKVSIGRSKVAIEWFNNHVNRGRNIAILIQYGHGTGTGGYVVGRDYINPAIRPIFDKIADDIWEKVRRA